MENTVYCSKSKSCQNFRIGHTIHLQWQEENERDVRGKHTGGEGGVGEEERRRRRSRIAKLADETQKPKSPIRSKRANNIARRGSCPFIP